MRVMRRGSGLAALLLCAAVVFGCEGPLDLVETGEDGQAGAANEANEASAQTGELSSEACEARCEAAADDTFDDCVAAGGSDERCAARARDAVRACIAERCGDVPPETDPPIEPSPEGCERRCEAMAERAFAECLTLSEAEGDPDECERFTAQTFERCLMSCGDAPEPDPASCEGICGPLYEGVFERCTRGGHDPEYCERFAREGVRCCLEA